MSLFKKKNNDPAIWLLLDDALHRAKEKNENNFYYMLYPSDIRYVEKWVKARGGIYYFLDHITDGQCVYKFKF